MKKIKGKILAAAIALIGFSTAASISGTVAWFTAANTVSVSGMSIKAETEDGIVIADQAASYTNASWKNSATAENTGAGLSFIPTSTADLGSNWYHNNSDSANMHTAANPYATVTGSLTDVLDTNDGYFVATNEGINNKKVYLVNKFYIQSSGGALADQYLYVQNLNVTVTRDIAGDSGNHDLNKALRVGFLCNEAKTIFAPMEGATANYFVARPAYNASATYAKDDIVYYEGQYYKAKNAIGSAESWTVDHWDQLTDSNADVKAVPSTLSASKIVISGESDATKIAIPQYTAAGHANKIEVKVFAYFEGEDAACTSANAALGLDTLALKFEIGNTKETTGLDFTY